MLLLVQKRSKGELGEKVSDVEGGWQDGIHRRKGKFDVCKGPSVHKM